MLRSPRPPRKKQFILGWIFASCRSREGLSRRAFCREHGLDPSMYTKLETGAWIPRQTRTLAKYALAIGKGPRSREWRPLLILAGLAPREDRTIMVGSSGLSLRFMNPPPGTPSPHPDEALLTTLFQRVGKLPGGASEMPPLKRSLP